MVVITELYGGAPVTSAIPGTTPSWPIATRGARTRSVPIGLVILSVYCALAFVAYWPVLPFDNSHMLATAPNDSTDVGWFLSWAGFAVTHLHNPLFSNWMDFPSGVNIPANQSMSLLGVLAAPITEGVGRFAMINFTMYLSFVISAMAMYLTLRQFCQRRLPAFVGGLFFGFCPSIVAHNLENPNFSFLPLLPLIFLFTYKVTTAESLSPRRDGLLLGLVCALQLYLNPEPLAEVLVALLVAVVVTLAWRVRRISRSDLSRIGVGLGFAAVLFVPLALPFAYYYLYGPQHVSGPVVGLQYLAVFHTDLAQLIVPDKNQLIGPSRLIAIGNTYTGGAINEAGSYLGIPLILGLSVIVVSLRRNRVIVFSAIAFVAAAVLSLGASLYINNHGTGIWLPGQLFLHLPILNSAETIRYFIAADLMVGVLVGVGLDRLADGWEARRQPAQHRMKRPVSSPVVVSVAAAAMLFPLVPRWPSPSYSIGVPSYFTSTEVNAIKPGAIVLTYPIPQSGAVQPLQWQMAANFRFKILSGYAYVANNGGVTLGNPPMLPSTLSTLLNAGWGNDPSATIPPLNVQNLENIREVLANFSVDDFIMEAGGNYLPVEREITVALGRAPSSVGGVLIWYNIPRLIRQSLHDVLVHDRKSGLISRYPPSGFVRNG